MALKPLRKTDKQSMEYVIPFYQERGGMLSIATLSGVPYAVYEMKPDANTVPLGIQQFDTTEIDLYREATARWNSHNAYPAYTPMPYIIAGEVITNAIDSTVTSINIWDNCYLAPSGLLTNSTKYGTKKVGRFLSILNAPEFGSLPLPTRLRIAGDDAIVNPDNVFARTAGWAKVAISL